MNNRKGWIKVFLFNIYRFTERVYEHLLAEVCYLSSFFLKCLRGVCATRIYLIMSTGRSTGLHVCMLVCGVRVGKDAWQVNKNS